MRLTKKSFIRGIATLLLTFAMVLSLAGCASNAPSNQSTQNTNSTNEIGDIDLSDWDAVVEAARGSEVNWWMSGSTTEINEWVDGPCAQYLKEKYDITLNRVAASSQEFVTQISSEMTAGVEEGSVDMIWVNGSQFNELKSNGYLFGPFTQDLPAAQYYDWSQYDNEYDAGVKIDGYEMPWHRYVSSFFADTAQVGTDLPGTLDEYIEFVKANPGKITYPVPEDSQGARFIYTVIANAIGLDEWNKVATDLTLTKEQVKEIIEPGLQALREMEPYLWNEGTEHPAKYSVLDTMYADGEVVANFNVRYPQAKVNNGTYPAGTVCFTLDGADLCYNSYIAIPKNASNICAALVAINAICSPDLEISKYEYTMVPSAMDVSKLTPDQVEALQAVQLGAASIDATEIEGIAIPLASGTAINHIKEIWYEEVFRGNQ